VELNLREGLNVEMEINWDLVYFTKRLDCWKLPFRCFACRELGHLWKNFPTKINWTPNNKIWVKQSHFYETLEDYVSSKEEITAMLEEKQDHKELNVNHSPTQKV
jgi:DNA-directed RNA polymerase subunit N (RpoN/RPB10)